MGGLFGQPGEKRIALARTDFLQTLEPSDEGFRLGRHVAEHGRDLFARLAQHLPLHPFHLLTVQNCTIAGFFAQAGIQPLMIEARQGAVGFLELDVRIRGLRRGSRQGEKLCEIHDAPAMSLTLNDPSKDSDPIGNGRIWPTFNQ
jgi:hypothetical protein